MSIPPSVVTPVLIACCCLPAACLSVHAEPPPPHPRLLFTPAQQKQCETLARTDKLLAALIEANTKKAGDILRRKAVRYEIPDGKRLLGQSRYCLDNVMTCAMAYRLTGDKRYADRACVDMRAAAAFKDWNPRHFLDTAEMTTALAIGYDWLFDALGENDRKTIREAIVKHGLNAGMSCYRKGGWWVATDNNWNQVCNGGMTLGALALMDEEPELARTIVDYAVKSIPRGMAVYAPDGAYPEGPGYWCYGTGYAVVMMNALTTALGTDGGIAKTPGLDRTGQFLMHAVSPAGLFFNYADGGEHYSPNAIPFVLSRTFDNLLLAWWQRDRLADELAHRHSFSDRFSALEIAWYDPRGDASNAARRERDACFRGRQPFAAMRSAWGDPDALYVAVKGGDNRTNHGHLDIGSFVLDADGVRWAVDLGGDDYNMPDYFGKKRWTYYRLNNFSHNTLAIDGKIQNPAAKAAVVRFASAADHALAVIDMGQAYAGQARGAMRGVSLLNGRKAVLVQDELTGASGTVRWGLMTRAEIKLDGDRAVLSRNGKRLHARLLEPRGASFSIADTKPPTERENQNKGTRMLTISVPGDDGSGKRRIAVLFYPDRFSTDIDTPELTPLAEWK